MTLSIPTAISMKLRFPEFSDVDDSAIEFAIEDARLDFGDGSNWSVGNSVALMYLCAHYVSCSITRASSGGAGSEGAIASESIGRLSITYARATTTPQATVDDMESTPYGRRYLELVGNNFGGPVIV